MTGVIDLSFDWLHDKWYYTDEPRHHVFVCDDPNSSSARLRVGQGRCLTLFQDNIWFPNSIAVDPVRGSVISIFLLFIKILSYIILFIKTLSYIILFIKTLSYIILFIKTLSYITLFIKTLSYITLFIKTLSYITLFIKTLSYITLFIKI